MKKLILLLFFPFFSFGQDDIDYSSEKSIIEYFESNPSDDLLEGIWDNVRSFYGAVLIKKISETKYAAIYCTRVDQMKFINDGDWNIGYNPIYNTKRKLTITPKYGDTLAILEKSTRGKKLYSSVYVYKTSGKGKNKIREDFIDEIVVDYPSLSNLGYFNKINSDIGVFYNGRKVFQKWDLYFDDDFWNHYETNERHLMLFLLGDIFPFVQKYPRRKIIAIRDTETVMDPVVGLRPANPETYNDIIGYKFAGDTLSSKKKKKKIRGWAGNGSGLIISRSGYIITNHHVIKDAEDIEVEFIINDELQKFNAEVVQSDKTNDLAIIKIFDMNFDGVKEPPFNFKTRASDVGTKVFAYGYPMALSLMGKEIKVTDGMINSKTGYRGNVTTYQITAPIQQGNSGGPLFDDKGNFIGINSAGLSKDVADNVGYTIKSSYVLNLIDVLPKSIDLPSNTKLQSLPLTEQIKEISKYVVLIKVK